MNDDRSLLARWSARKRAVAAETEAEPAAPRPADGAQPDGPTPEQAANRAAAEAVDLDSLGKGSDLSVFFREGVPELLRNAALRRVWRSDPVFANLDQLVDYGEDYGRKDLILKTFASAWQAGRGYVEDAAAPPKGDPAVQENDARGPDTAPDPADPEIARATQESSRDDQAPAAEAPGETPADPTPESASAGTAPEEPPKAVRKSSRLSLRARLAGDAPPEDP